MGSQYCVFCVERKSLWIILCKVAILTARSGSFCLGMMGCEWVFSNKILNLMEEWDGGLFKGKWKCLGSDNAFP